jgi:hypothetical protein
VFTEAGWGESGADLGPEWGEPDNQRYPTPPLSDKNLPRYPSTSFEQFFLVPEISPEKTQLKIVIRLKI